MSGRADIGEELSAYLDGELSRAEADEVELAMRRSPDLAAQLRELRATRELLRGLYRERAGEDFAPRVLAEAERRQLLSGRRVGPAVWLGRLAAAAAVLMAATVGAIVFLAVQGADRHAGLAGAAGEGETLLADARQAPGAAGRVRRAERFAKGAPTAGPNGRDSSGLHYARRAIKDAAGGSRIGSAHRKLSTSLAASPLAAAVAEQLDAATTLGLQGSPGVKLAFLQLNGLGITTEHLELEVADLSAARREVEAMLAARNIQAVAIAAAKPPPAPTPAPAVRPASRQSVTRPVRAGIYRSLWTGPEEVHYVVYGAPEQLAQVTLALSDRHLTGEDVRARRFCANVPPAATPAPLAPRSAPASRPRSRGRSARPPRYDLAKIARLPVPKGPTTAAVGAATAKREYSHVLVITLGDVARK